MAKKEKQVKENKNNRYFKDMKAELKKVVWPTPKQLFNNTVGVIAFVLIFAIIVFILDVCLDSLNKYGIVKLQEKVQSAFSSSEENLSDGNLENVTSENNAQAEASNEESNENSDSMQDENAQAVPEASETENTSANQSEVNE